MDPKWQTPGVELPPPEVWWKIYRFPEKRKRKTISNPDTAKELAEKFVPEGSKGKVIVEAWAGEFSSGKPEWFGCRTRYCVQDLDS